MTDQTTTDETETEETGQEQQETGPEAASGAESDPETFPRDYVQRLRQEAASARTRAKDRDTLAEALWVARVTATGRLADPTDLPMPDDADPLDADAITAAVEALLAAKPHLGSRRPTGDIGQGATGAADTVDLAGLLRARA